MPAPIIDVVIPARNERASLPLVLQALPRERLRSVVVADNGSAPPPRDVAREHGAEVVPEAEAGYGAACLAGLAAVRAKRPAPEIVVFVDADYSDHPDELPRLVAPIVEDRADLVIGSRVLGRREPGALLPQARIGNFIAARLIRWLYRVPVTDLGPFRAVRWASLESLGMQDRNFGWTAEMQVKAARRGLRIVEVPVSYRKRIGRSKITGTVSGTVRAGWKILYTVFRYAR